MADLLISRNTTPFGAALHTAFSTLKNSWRYLGISGVCLFLVACTNSADLPLGRGGATADSTACPTTCGNPINYATGNKYEHEMDFQGAGPFPLMLSRDYNSQDEAVHEFGGSWRSMYTRSIAPVSASEVKAIRDDGREIAFTLTVGVWTPDSIINSRLAKTASGWVYTSGIDDSETYDTVGRLVAVKNLAGLSQTMAYDASGNLATVTDPFGRKLRFSYKPRTTGVGSLITQVIVPDGGIYTYAYIGRDNLASVTYPDGSKRQFLYEIPTEPYALTGIIDEKGSRFATFGYRRESGSSQTLLTAVSTEHAGSTLKYTVDYSDFRNGNVFVTQPLGSVYQHKLEVIKGAVYEDSIARFCPTCTSGAGGATANTFDTSGNVTRATDFNGNITTYGYDLARNLQTTRTEAFGTPQARTITTAWHPSFRLPTQIVEPNRTTNLTYDARGNLLTKSTTAGAITRTSTYTYNANGQVLTIDGPRTDVADVTRFIYDPQGNLTSITNALGHVVIITSYDAVGRPLTIRDPNGLITTLTYNFRGQVTSRNIGGEVTNYAYDPAGQLSKATLPDGSFLSMAYDGAQRLIGMTDTLGNRIAYTLDALGNRTKEGVFDPTGALAQAHSHAFDALSKLAKGVGALNQTTIYAYDNNGNRTNVTDPLNHGTKSVFDALNRLVQLFDANNQPTALGYDANERLTRVTDPRSLTTTYNYNGLDDQTSQVSPDTGTTSRTFDSAGNVATSTDARGSTTRYSYDALNRVARADYADGQAAQYQYDQGINGIGRLTSMTDSSGATTSAYDLHGRVLNKRQQTGTVTLTTSTTYDTAGRLASTTYPSGRVITLTYNSNGQVSALTTGTSMLVKNVQYHPVGAVTSWTAGNGNVYNRTFDQDGRIVDYGLLSHFTPFKVTLAYDAASRITGITDTVFPSKTFGYDALDRLTSYVTTGETQNFTYDPTGNRQSLTATAGSTAYTYDSTSNRLLSSTGAVSQSFGYDAVSNTTSTTASTGSTLFAYDGRSRMVKAGTGVNVTDYALNGLGQRVRKSGFGTGAGTGGAQVFSYDANGQLMGEYDSAGRAIQETIWLGDLPVAVLMPGQQPYFIYPDHLGAPRQIAALNSKIVWSWNHDPFGNSLPVGALNYNPRFPGQYFDVESGLHYNMARYYHPSTGRYFQSDPIGLTGGTNTFGYSAANPLIWTDPSGEILPLLVGAALVGGLFSEDIYLWNSIITGQPVTLGGAAGAFAGGAVAGGLGVIAAPLAATIGLADLLGTAGGAFVINAVAGAAGTAIPMALDPCATFDPALIGASALLGGVTGAASGKLFRTYGMDRFRQVGFPRTWAAVVPPGFGGSAKTNAIRSIYKSGIFDALFVGVPGAWLGDELAKP